MQSQNNNIMESCKNWRLNLRKDERTIPKSCWRSSKKVKNLFIQRKIDSKRICQENVNFIFYNIKKFRAFKVTKLIKFVLDFFVNLAFYEKVRPPTFFW